MLKDMSRAQSEEIVVDMFAGAGGASCGPTSTSWARPATTDSTTSWTKSGTGSGNARRCWSGGRCQPDRLGNHRKAADRPFPHRLRAAEIPARAVHPLGCGDLLRPYPARGRPGHMSGLVREGGSSQERRGRHHEPLSVAVSLHGHGTPRRRAGSNHSRGGGTRNGNLYGDCLIWQKIAF